MIYTEKSCKKFIEAAASKEPVPGGGSVAALAGALGTSLGHMVGALTVGKKKYADVEDEMMELMKEGRQLQRELLDLVQADIDMFEPLSQLYSLKPETDEEIAGFHSLLEGNLKKYGAVPVHSVADLLDFKNSRLTNETVFLGAFDEGRMVAAGMLFYFEQSRVLHAQNLPTDLSITEYSPVSALYYESMLLALRMGCKALSWGISTEDRGKTLNLGLIGSKEGYGSNKNLFRTFYKEY